MKAFVFPGQGSQFEGMGKDLYESSDAAAAYFDQANVILGFDLKHIMFNGTAEELKDTNVTQPAIFTHSVVSFLINQEEKPDMVAGHSLGEFSALVASGVLSFEDGLRLVKIRANAMQKACEITEGTMAAIVGLDDEIIEETCKGIDELVIPANYNCPGQLVISGSKKGIEAATEQLKEKGARRAIVLPVGGAFHSPLMEPARKELADAIDRMTFNKPSCPIYQNVNGQAQTDPATIKENLVAQLTSSVRWTQTMQNMQADGLSEVVEVGGNGKVLSGMFKKLDRSISTRPLV